MAAEDKRVAKELTLEESISAPVYTGDTLGALTVRDADGNAVAVLPLLAGEDVERVTLWQMFLRYLARGFCAAPHG